MGWFSRRRQRQRRQAPAVRPAWAEPLVRPEPRGQHNLIVITLDSCRYDTFMAAAPRIIPKLSQGRVEKRYSYAAWTAPSHYNLLMGLLPHTSPTQVFAAEYYRQDFLAYNQRLGTTGMAFSQLLPTLWFPTFLRRTLGYTTHARVSLPVLHPRTPLNVDFDSFLLMDRHNDMAAMLNTLTFAPDRPSFYLLNVGETHYPYASPVEAPESWPRLSGVHGVFQQLEQSQAQHGQGVSAPPPAFFTQEELGRLRQRQIAVVQYLDKVFEKLYDLVPVNTWIVVTADHGELFGESGYFGHGPIHHPVLYEVPFLEGKLR